MRHRRKGRTLGRSPSHQRALLKNLASSLFLTERDAEDDDNKPKVKGRIITTLEKAKEVRPLVERCITIARKALPAQQEADKFGTTAERNSEAWKDWRKSAKYAAVEPGHGARWSSPAAARLRLLGDKQAVRILFAEVAPAVRRSARRIHAHSAAGQAAAGRRRHAGDPGVRRRARPRPPARREADVRSQLSAQVAAVLRAG